MPDITVCLNMDCPLRLQCYRYTAMASNMQSFADFKPNENGKCNKFLNNKKV